MIDIDGCGNLGGTLATDRIYLCGPLVALVGGERIDPLLPGRQSKLAFAYLVTNKDRHVERARLMEALWGGSPPADPETALSAILSKMRKMIAPLELEGRGSLRLVMPATTWVDIDAATEALHRAESAASRGLFHDAWSPARVTLHIAARGFLTDFDAPWIDELRRRVEELHLRALECYGEACLAIGGTEIDGARRCGQVLVTESPYRESGYRILMRAHEAEGNPAEALRLYGSLKARLAEELGASPGAQTRQLHEDILGRSEGH
jgi:SARP family transcriptional regulator, regulator of embCAB operon